MQQSALICSLASEASTLTGHAQEYGAAAQHLQLQQQQLGQYWRHQHHQQGLVQRLQRLQQQHPALPPSSSSPSLLSAAAPAPARKPSSGRAPATLSSLPVSSPSDLASGHLSSAGLVAAAAAAKAGAAAAATAAVVPDPQGALAQGWVEVRGARGGSRRLLAQCAHMEGVCATSGLVCIRRGTALSSGEGESRIERGTATHQAWTCSSSSEEGLL